MTNLIKISFIIFSIFFIQGCAIIKVDRQPIEKIVKIEGKSKNELFVLANNWMIHTFNNAESVIQFSDKESGTITGKYLMGIVSAANEYGPGQKAMAIINIQIKDGACKLTISPQPFQYAEGNLYTLYTKDDMERDLKLLIDSFERGMTQESNDNW